MTSELRESVGYAKTVDGILLMHVAYFVWREASQSTYDFVPNEKQVSFQIQIVSFHRLGQKPPRQAQGFS